VVAEEAARFDSERRGCVARRHYMLAKTRLFPLLIALVLVPAAVVHGQASPIVRIESAGKSCAGAGPRKLPPAADEAVVPHAECSLTDRNVRDASGNVVSAIGVYVWREGAVTRVRVYTLVPAPGAPNRWLNESGDASAMKRPKFLADYTISPGEAKPIAEMRALGTEPMILRLSETPRTP